MKIFVGGDVVNETQDDGRIIGGALQAIIASADLSVLNFEGPVRGHGAKVPKVGRHIANRVETVQGLAEQGVDLLLLANNHIMDYGEPGLMATMTEIESAGMSFIGAGTERRHAYRALVRELDGVRVGLLNVGEAQFGALDSQDQTSGYAWINDPSMESRVTQLREQADFVVVLPHAGLEDAPVPQRYWRDKYRWLCDLGADVVVGGHPHVPQGFERYGKSVIIYSLGNFFFDKGDGSGDESPGMSVLLDLESNRAVGVEVIHHRRRGNVVEVASAEDRVDVDALCEMLGERYGRIHAEMTRQRYRSLERMLLTAVGRFPHNPDVARWARRAVRRAIGRPVEDANLLLLHAFRNETWRHLGEEFSQLARL